MSTHQHRGEIPSLTGLRGLAALLVVLAHYSLWMSVVPLTALPEWIVFCTATGSIGMAIFFTLSGYVIALSYGDWDWRARPGFNLLRFFLYRLARLYPAFFLFAVLIVMRTPSLHDLTDAQARSYVVPHLLLAQTWWPMKFNGVNAGDGFFHVSWSVSTEAALYLMFGLGAIVVSILPPWRAKPALVAIALVATTATLLSLAWSVRGHLAPAGWSDDEWDRWLFYLSPYGCAVLFGIGVATYRISRLALPPGLTKLASNLGVLVLIVVYVRIATGMREPTLVRAMAVGLGTALLMIGARSDSFANRILSSRSIIYVGTISYSLYLFHFAVPTVFGGQFSTFDRAAAAFYGVNFVVATTLAIMLATGIYRLLEVPGRRVLRAFADRLLGE